MEWVLALSSFVAISLAAIALGAGWMRRRKERAAVAPQRGPRKAKPTTGPEWRRLRLPRSRGGHAAIAHGGRVFLLGGSESQTGAAVRPVDVFEPASGGWSTAGELGDDCRHRFSATLLDSGDVLLVGRTHAQIHSLEAATCRRVRAMHTPRHGHTAVLDARGRVVVVGGYVDQPRSDGPLPVEIFDVSLEAWREGPPPAVDRNAPAVVRLADGRVLVAGGSDDKGKGVVAIAEVEIFDPETESWSRAAPMAGGRFEHTLTLLPDGNVLAIGGVPGEADPLDRVERYDPATDRWLTVGFTAAARAGHTATLLGDGRVLVVGDDTPGASGVPFAEIYDPRTNTSTELPVELVDTPDGHAVAQVGDSVVVTGGWYESRAGFIATIT